MVRHRGVGAAALNVCYAEGLAIIPIHERKNYSGCAGAARVGCFHTLRACGALHKPYGAEAGNLPVHTGNLPDKTTKKRCERATDYRHTNEKKKITRPDSTNGSAHGTSQDSAIHP